MMNVSTLTVLLVCVMLEFAHSASIERGWVDFSSRNKRSTLNRFSVVNDWDTVCKEVCRAGYGGPGCRVGCNVHVSLSDSNENRFEKLCPYLCENDLGIKKCNCTSVFGNPNTPFARNSLCSATCSWRQSLNGCSNCVSEIVDGDDDTTDGTTTNITDEDSSTTEEHSTTDSNEYDRTSEENSTDFTEDDSTSTTEEPTTTTSTTTTTQPTTTTTRTTTQATTTTTPNWESLCEALCRIVISQ